MKIRPLSTPTLLLVVLLSTAAPAEEITLSGGLARLEPWLGTWQIEATWAGGATLWSQAEYRPMLDGAFIDSVVSVRDNGGELYQRYRSILAAGDSGDHVAAHTFSREGYKVGDFALQGNGVGMVMTTGWTYGGSNIKERLEQTDADTWHWQVWVAAEGSEAWEQIMDGEWHRVEAEPIVLPGSGELHESLAVLQPFLGGWEARTSRRDGSAGWSRNEARVGLAGRFLDVDAWELRLGADSYRRTTTVFFPESEAGAAGCVSFLSDGTLIYSPVTISAETGGAVLERLIPSGVLGERELRQVIRLSSSEVFQLQLASRLPGEEEWRQGRLIRFQRQGPADGVTAYPIDERFVGAAGEPRSFTKDVAIEAPVDTVWAAWTTAQGWAAVYGPPSRADIELAIGGRYEWLFDGSIGGNGCQVLSYLPKRMISFSWNAPPSQPETRLQRTWVVVELEPISAQRTQLRLSHLGFGDGPAWDTTYAYFDNAWDRVLAGMQSALGR